ncbi:MAG: stage II sporulation protein E, partial [Clostridiales bacterium]|nr:stage II sporulation protein E [Clostridiales bacterium]
MKATLSTITSASRLPGTMKKTVSDALARIAGTLLLSLVGLMMSRASVFGSYAPFGVAFAAAAPQGSAVFVALGTALGYLLPGGTGSSIRYIAAVLAVSALRWVLAGFGRVMRYTAVPPLLSAAGVLASGLALSAPLGLTPYIVLMTAAESVLAAGGTFFFRKSIAVFHSSRRISSLTQQELAAVVITLGTLLLSISEFTIAGISPGRILSCILILCAARYGQAAGGSIAGVTVGLMLSLSGGEMNPFSGVYAFGGLMAGLFAPVGRLAPALAFAAAAGISSMRISGGAEVFAGLYETTIASAVFVLLPERLLGSVRTSFRTGSDGTDADSLRHSVVMRLDFAAKALSEVSDAVDSVTQKLRTLCAPDLSSVYERCSDTVCRGCGLKMFCWGPAYQDTQTALNDMTQILRAQGKVEKEDVPPVFARRCCHL